MKIKLCGIRRHQDVEYLNEFMPDYAGFILTQGFKRSIDQNTFNSLAECLNRNIKRVGVFVNEPCENILTYFADRLDIIQLHGTEDNNYIELLRQNCVCEIWKAVRVKSASDIESADLLNCHKLLIDSYVEGIAGGTGKIANTQIIKNTRICKPYFLAGGLNSDNIKDLLKDIRPFGVDISSGIEIDGFKDREKIKNIINTVRSVDFEH